MKTSLSGFLQSHYYNSALNSAIYDGPVRIYFNQLNETQALKIYFLLQEKMKEELQRAKDLSKALGSIILVTMYTTPEMYGNVFVGSELFPIQHFDGDYIIGLNGPLVEQDADMFLNQIRSILNRWDLQHRQLSAPEMNL